MSHQLANILSIAVDTMMTVGGEVTQLCPTLCDPMNFTVHGILQAGILEWVAFPFSRGSSQPRDRTQSLSLWEDSLPAEPQGKPIMTINVIN